jgi:hypothetical protein
MVALHSAVLDSITLQPPFTRPVSPRPPHPSHTMVARSQGYTQHRNSVGSSLVQGENLCRALCRAESPLIVRFVHPLSTRRTQRHDDTALRLSAAATCASNSAGVSSRCAGVDLVDLVLPP